MYTRTSQAGKACRASLWWLGCSSHVTLPPGRGARHAHAAHTRRAPIILCCPPPPRLPPQPRARRACHAHFRDALPYLLRWAGLWLCRRTPRTPQALPHARRHGTRGVRPPLRLAGQCPPPSWPKRRHHKERPGLQRVPSPLLRNMHRHVPGCQVRVCVCATGPGLGVGVGWAGPSMLNS